MIFNGVSRRWSTQPAALWQLAWSRRSLGIIDGTLIAIDRLGGDLNRLYN